MQTTLTCSECGAKLAGEVLGGLCPKCTAQVSLASIFGNFDAAGQGEAPPAHSLLDQVRRVGDYELLAEIGRGGMGVVYCARQISLNRVVALKMILAGHFASEKAVQRFRAEAEVAANFKHPNIVAIHETGVHDGLHFFSMDYIEGKDLAALTKPKGLPPKQAARYLVGIARAVQYAHDHGILHRDLKPSNILIDGRDQPQITDFGLAKRLLEDSDITLTGQIMGSPNYLAPEQVTSKSTHIGVQADVYSLGAILYHLLLGHPLFTPDTITQALWQVVHQDPVPPRTINPSVPRDLETICLKCLEKDPNKRYASAEALAGDLESWLEGKPISARPLTRTERLWRWTRKHPAAAAIILILVLAPSGCGLNAIWRRAHITRFIRQHPERIYLNCENGIFVFDPSGSNWCLLGERMVLRDVDSITSRLCFSEGQVPRKYLCQAKADGTGKQRLINAVGPAQWLDSDNILFEADDLTSVWAVHIPTLKKRKLFDWSAITTNGFSGNPVVSPDRKRILANPQNQAYAPTQDLFISDTNGQHVTVVWEDRENNIEDGAQLWLSDNSVIWSRPAQTNTYVADRAIIRKSLDETNYHAITEWKGWKYPLAVSPDRTKILYAMDDFTDHMEIWVMESDGSNARKFTDLTFARRPGLSAWWVRTR
jgi:hypothetical protein